MPAPPLLVCGNANSETSLSVGGFPLAYAPLTFAPVTAAPGGVGFNLTAALSRLGHRVRLLSLVGPDAAGAAVRAALRTLGADDAFLHAGLSATTASVVLVGPDGERAVHADLKDAPTAALPEALLERALDDARMVVAANIGYARPLLRSARQRGVRVVCDVQALADAQDGYNRDFLEAADLLFLSHERLPEPPAAFARRLHALYGTPAVVVGLGAGGALLSLADGTQRVQPAVAPRGVVSTVGAGDALAAGFVHATLAGAVPAEALRLAALFAGHKVGEAGASRGHLTAAELDALARRTHP